MATKEADYGEGGHFTMTKEEFESLVQFISQHRNESKIKYYGDEYGNDDGEQQEYDPEATSNEEDIQDGNDDDTEALEGDPQKENAQETEGLTHPPRRIRRIRQTQRSFMYLPSRGLRSLDGSKGLMEEMLKKTQHGEEHYNAFKKLGFEMFDVYFDEMINNLRLNNTPDDEDHADELNQLKAEQSKLDERKKKLEEDRKEFLEKHCQKT